MHSEILGDLGVQPDEPWLVNLHETLQFAQRKKGERPCLTSSSNRIWIYSHGSYVKANECALMQGFDLRRLSAVVSNRRFITMLGNSMSVDVLKVILGGGLPALTHNAQPGEWSKCSVAPSANIPNT